MTPQIRAMGDTAEQVVAALLALRRADTPDSRRAAADALDRHATAAAAAARTLRPADPQLPLETP